MPDMRADSQVSFLVHVQGARPADLAFSLLKGDLQDLGQVGGGDPGEFVTDDLLEPLLDAGISFLDVLCPIGTGLNLLLPHTAVDAGGDGNTDLASFRVDHHIDNFTCSLCFLATIGGDVDIALGNERVIRRQRSLLDRGLTRHNTSTGGRDRLQNRNQTCLGLLCSQLV